LPTDAEMAAYLVGERKFNPNVVSSVLADFRATAECADLKSMPMPEPRFDAPTLDAYSRTREVRSRTASSGTHTKFFLKNPFGVGNPTADELRRVLERRFEEEHRRMASIPIADGETATITMPKQMSPQSWQMLLDTLELWKKQASEA
jgi:hypothetical protein